MSGQRLLRSENCSFDVVSAFPANKRCWPSVELMLGQRRRRWAKISSTSDQHLLFAGFLLIAAGKLWERGGGVWPWKMVLLFSARTLFFPRLWWSFPRGYARAHKLSTGSVSVGRQGETLTKGSTNCCCCEEKKVDVKVTASTLSAKRQTTVTAFSASGAIVKD